MTDAVPDSAVVARLAARAMEFVGWRRAAAKFYRRALRRDARDVESSFRLGETLAALERWDEAALAFRQAARHWPTCAETRGNLAFVLARAGREEAAVAALRELAGLQPQRAELHALLGAWLRRRQRPAEALRAFRDALDAESAPDTTRFLLGEALLGCEAWRTLADEVRRARAIVGRETTALTPVARAPLDTPRALARLSRALRSRFQSVARDQRALVALALWGGRRLRRRGLLALGRRFARTGHAALALRCFRAADRLRAASAEPELNSGSALERGIHPPDPASATPARPQAAARRAAS